MLSQKTCVHVDTLYMCVTGCHIETAVFQGKTNLTWWFISAQARIFTPEEIIHNKTTEREHQKN